MKITFILYAKKKVFFLSFKCSNPICTKIIFYFKLILITSYYVLIFIKLVCCVIKKNLAIKIEFNNKKLIK